MRLVALALAASLATSGCAYLAVPPATGAALGAVIGGSRRANNKDVSVTKHVVIGGLVGVAVDVVVVVVAAVSLAHALESWSGEDLANGARTAR